MSFPTLFQNYVLKLLRPPCTHTHTNELRRFASSSNTILHLEPIQGEAESIFVPVCKNWQALRSAAAPPCTQRLISLSQLEWELWWEARPRIIKHDALSHAAGVDARVHACWSRTNGRDSKCFVIVKLRLFFISSSNKDISGGGVAAAVVAAFGVVKTLLDFYGKDDAFKANFVSEIIAYFLAVAKVALATHMVRIMLVMSCMRAQHQTVPESGTGWVERAHLGGSLSIYRVATNNGPQVLFGRGKRYLLT